jgi:RluA family pseudouridine synthase
MITITVSGQDEGVRLDRLLRKNLGLLSLPAIYRLIRTGGVKVNGRSRKQDYRCHEADAITVAVDPSEASSPKGSGDDGLAGLVKTEFYRRNFKLIYEDEQLLVCDKPVNLVVHGGTGHTRHDTLIDLAASHCLQTAGRHKETVHPELVHRLDRDTSGVILLAKDKRLLRSLHENLRSRDLKKEYVALCWGTLPARKGVIDVNLVKVFERNDGTKVRVDEEEGQASSTGYRVLSVKAGVSRVALELHTGRTHQIRVHLAHLGCPIIGDVRYGDQARDQELFTTYRELRRLYLHAATVSFFYPLVNRDVSFNAPEPEAFGQLWRALQ